MIYIFSYVILTSIVSFVLFGVDKYKALRDQRRISENMLLWSVAVGGWIGGVFGMTVFRHKTLKSSFLRKFWVIVLGWIIVSYILLFVFANKYIY